MSAAIDRCDFSAGDVIGNYRITATLGEGSFGIVYQVNDASGTRYALKILKLWAVPADIRQKLIDRFVMEYETGQIPSDYLVRSVAHGYVNNVPYIVMEYCPRGNLLQLADAAQPADLARAAREILYGLRALHRCGKVHRDLKPENVLFKADGTATLTDFGIAGDRNKRLTERGLWGSPGQIFGTYAFMPPEQLRGDRNATVLPTTDLFSFGVMMYLVITGQLPFGRLNDESDLVNYMRNGREGRWDKEALKRNRLGNQFVDAITGCLEPDFRKRLQTADEVLKLLPSDSTAYNPPDDDQKTGDIGNGVQLRVMQGEEHGKVYKLNELLKGANRIVTMGRYDDGITNNGIQLLEEQSSYISRKHCTLEKDYATQYWYIRDGQWDRDSADGWRRSKNGTFVNSAEVTNNGMILRAGDIISLGDVKLRVEGNELINN
jgi:serine/threonine protein kinase